MIVADLLNDAAKAGDAAGVFRVVVATRTVDGTLLESGRVHLSDAGELQVDSAGGDVDVVPTEFMDAPGSCLTIADVRRLVLEQPATAQYTLSGVTRVKQLAEGGRVLMTEQVLGTYRLAGQDEIWLLLHPQEPWPRHWSGG